MSEIQESIAAAIVEIGLPLLTAAGCAIFPRQRRRLVVALGALTPISLVYWYLLAFFGLAWLRQQWPEDDWAFHAAWIMTFAAFMLSVVLGALLAFVPYPKRNWARYLMGLLAPLLVVGIYNAHHKWHWW